MRPPFGDCTHCFQLEPDCTHWLQLELSRDQTKLVSINTRDSASWGDQEMPVNCLKVFSSGAQAEVQTTWNFGHFSPDEEAA